MDTKKTAYTLLIASSAFLACSTIAAVPEEKTPAATQTEVSPFDQQLKADDIEPAIIKDLKVLGNDIKDGAKSAGKTIKEGAKATGEAVSEAANTAKDATVETTEKVIDAFKVHDSSAKTLPNLEKIELPALNSNSHDAKTVKVEVASHRIPAGTRIPVKLENAITTVSASMGDQFTATLPTDVMIGDNILLPAGSVIRGTVGQMQKANLCFKEAKIMLIFDHIVTPAGKQLPLYAYMSGYSNVDYAGFITGGSSYGKEFKKDAMKGKDIVVNATNYGVDKGLEYLNGVPVVLTAPVCAIGGAIGGLGYVAGKSIYNIFMKGDEVNLNKGTILNITLSKPLDVPVN